MKTKLWKINEQNLNNTNLALYSDFISKNYIKENLDEYKYLESYDVFKVFPSKLVINIKQTTLLASTIKDNKKYIVGSNGKLIDYKTFNLNLDLPNIFGDFSKKDFISFFNIITE